MGAKITIREGITMRAEGQGSGTGMREKEGNRCPPDGKPCPAPGGWTFASRPKHEVGGTREGVRVGTCNKKSVGRVGYEENCYR